MVRPPKQEKLPAVPGVTEVAPGVARVQLPVRFTGLGHVNMYVLEDDRGATVVDPGLPTRSSWQAARRGLAEMGLPLRRVHTVFVTHSHPDHFGGVGRLLRGAGDAVMAASDRYRTWWRPHGHVDLEDLDRAERQAEARARRGAYPWQDPRQAEGWRGRLRSLGPKNLFLGSMRSPVPDRRLADGDRFEVGGGSWVAVHTPGHTGDHLCLFDREHGTLLTGDHVLPTITPHVGALGSGSDPLGTYLASLDKVAALDASLALPAHGLPFSDVGQRAKEIVDHHDRRLDQIVEALAANGPATTQELSRLIYPERLWGYLAESETYAHLVHLEATDRVDRLDGDGPPRFALGGGRSS